MPLLAFKMLHSVAFQVSPVSTNDFMGDVCNALQPIVFRIRAGLSKVGSRRPAVNFALCGGQCHHVNPQNWGCPAVTVLPAVPVLTGDMVCPQDSKICFLKSSRIHWPKSSRFYSAQGSHIERFGTF